MEEVGVEEVGVEEVGVVGAVEIGVEGVVQKLECHQGDLKGVKNALHLT
jgi:hypothetical protein